MRLCSFAGLDIGGLGSRLSNWFKTKGPKEHTFDNIIEQQTYLNYPYDKMMTRQTFADSIQKEPYDFYILRWMDTDFIYDLARTGLINQFNCFVKIHGSDARYYPYRYAGLQRHTGLTIVANGYDYFLHNTIVGGLVVQHIPVMIEVDKLWAMQLKSLLLADHMIIGHAPTDPAKKGTAVLENAVKMLQLHDKADIELRVIQGKSWEEAVTAKSACHVIFDQISTDVGIGTFGQTALEGLAQSKIVLGEYNKWTYSMYPELAQVIVPVMADTLAAQIMEIKKAGQWAARYNMNDRGLKWVRDHFDVNVVAQQYLYLIEHLVGQAGK